MILDKIDEYINNYCAIQKGFTDKTIKTKKETLTRFADFADKLTKETIRDYNLHLANKGWQANSRRTELKIIKAFISWLAKEGHIKDNWGKDIELPKVRRKFYEFVEISKIEKAILAAPNKESHLPLRFALRTGLRKTELLKLKPTHFNWDNSTFQVHSKGGDIDIQPLAPSSFVNEVKRHASKANSKLFDISGKALNKNLKKGCKAVGIRKLTLHDLRHHFASDLLQRNVPLQIVSRLMRHSSVEVTDSTYSHYQITDLKHALTKHTLISKDLSKEDKAKMLVDGVEKYSSVIETKLDDDILEMKVRL